MSTVPMCSNIFSKDHVLTITKLIRQNDRGIADGNVSTGDVFRCFSSSIAGDVGRRWHVIRHTGELCVKAKMGEGADVFCTVQNRRPITFHASIEEPVAHRVYSIEGPEKSYSKNVLQRDKSCGESYGSNTSTNERQLKALDSYFSKLHNEMSGPPSMPKNEEYQMDPSSTQLLDKMIKSVDGSNQLKTKKGIGSLDDYFDKLNMGVYPPKKKLSSFDEKTTDSNEKTAPPSISGERHKRSEERINELNSYMLLESKNDENGLSAYGDENFQDLQHDDEASDLYMISILASINIAVFFFEIASPIGNSDVERLSLPLMYGAKINELILGGEWWRLVTPMFLHSGFLHVALGCWVLLTFGPQVCRGYGSFTFFLIYILGGISGNLSSFVHTPEATVGGTGPVFAILGAWFIYQIQNKEMIPKEEMESMFQKAVIITVLTFILSNFERIDDWTHLGAACAGLVYGFLTCPALQLDDASSKNGQEDGIALIRRQADPCKSLFTFVVFILILSSLFFFFGTQFETLEVNSFV